MVVVEVLEVVAYVRGMEGVLQYIFELELMGLVAVMEMPSPIKMVSVGKKIMLKALILP